jgi:hypothetical protein
MNICTYRNISSLASHPSHKEGLIDKLFHHKDNQEGGGQGNESHPTQAREPQKKEGEIDKLEDDINKDDQEFKYYLKEDKKLEKEGDEYGGLM